MSRKLLCFLSISLILFMSIGAIGADTIWEGRISDGDDDIEEHVPAGNMDIGSSDVEIPYEDNGPSDAQIVGLRFLNVDVPRGSAISNAYIELTCDETKSGSAYVSVIIEGELSPSAAAFATSANNLSGRTATQTKAVWVAVPWTAAGQVDQTSNIGPVIEEIVGQAGWAPGNALVLMLRDNPDDPSAGIRCAESYNGSASDAALLHIEWGAPTKAKEPTPAEGVDEVSRDTVLGWQPSPFAQTHNVYLGTAADDLAAISQGQAATSVDPGRLEFGQTYYWRVDEVNGAPDRTVFEGDVWSFTVEPEAVPVTNVTATASAANPGMGPEKTVDGSGLDAMDQHNMEAGDMWLAAGANNWIQYDFDRAYKLHEMLVWNSNQPVEAFLGFGVKEVTIEYTADGTTWMALDGVTTLAQAPGLATYQANTIVDMGGITAASIKLSVVSAYGMIGQSGLSEVRFMAIPTGAQSPIPADGSTVDSVTVDLGWRAGREAASHEIYLGTDPAALAMVDTTTENTATVSGLDFSTTYSWSVTEVNEAEAPTAHAGPVWSFTTPDYEVIDDFDSYTDDMDAGEAIFQAWIDGYDDNSNGSLVGNDPSPFAEKTIVKSGQSMPFFYNNAGAGMSEATLDLDQDWSVSGIKTLALAFHGMAGNTGTLYVKINNVKIPYDLAASDIAIAGWQAWNIDLTGVSGLQNVRSLTIGVDGGNAAGTLYIDDIRVYAQTGETVTPTMPGTAALVGYWPFDGDFQDMSGSGNHGTAGGAPLFVAGTVGQAVDLGGGSDYVAIDGIANAVTSTDLTISLWANTIQTDEGNMVALNDSASAHPFMLGVTNSNVFVNDGGDTEFPPAISDGEWHHVGYVREGSVGTIYVDGRERGTYTSTFSLASVTRWSFGQEWDGTTPSDLYMGQLDEARIYNAPLSASDIAGLAGLTAPVHKPL